MQHIQDMGNFCSCQVSIVGKVHDVEYDECNQKDIDFTSENGGSQVTFKGSSKSISMYCKKGTKGINQDAVTVWEVTFFMHLPSTFVSYFCIEIMILLRV